MSSPTSAIPLMLCLQSTRESGVMTRSKGLMSNSSSFIPSRRFVRNEARIKLSSTESVDSLPPVAKVVSGRPNNFNRRSLLWIEASIMMKRVNFSSNNVACWTLSESSWNRYWRSELLTRLARAALILSKVTVKMRESDTGFLRVYSPLSSTN